MLVPPKLILAPTDFSAASVAAVDVAADLASRFESILCLIHVVPMIPRLPASISIFREGDYERELHRDAENRLSKISADIATRGIQVEHEVGTANDVPMEIIRIAEHRRADLIVIATHGATGWNHLAFGSVAEKVVHVASCPVLMLRAAPKNIPAPESDTEPVEAS